MAQHDILRISREVADIERGTDLSLAVAYTEHDMRNVRALIVGPPGTPYEFGFFEFSIKFPPDYPSKPPKVEAKTTNHGRCRFNPNIYAGGKVCLSILGTWHGERGEEWSSAQGLESTLLSIQSLMSSNPYANEPGYENCTDDTDKELREAYCAKIQHETLRISVIQKLEAMLHIQSDGTLGESAEPSNQEHADGEEQLDQDPADRSIEREFKPFNDLLKRRFLWYYESYVSNVMANLQKHTPGSAFTQMPFESRSNGMLGRFQHVNLMARLAKIHNVLLKESMQWGIEGHKAVEQDLSIAYNLRNQFNQFLKYQKEKQIHNIDVDLLDGNPFVWIMTYFGRSGSNLDGGMFKIRISLSPRFPQEQPRVQFATKIFHHRVSQLGTICYFPTRVDEVKHHIVAIILAIEEVSPPYDPRAVVRLEATKLFWGSDNDKKQYNRIQRKSAADSMEANLDSDTTDPSLTSEFWTWAKPEDGQTS